MCLCKYSRERTKVCDADTPASADCLYRDERTYKWKNSRYFNAADMNTSCWFSNCSEQKPNIHLVLCRRGETSAAPERLNESAVSGSDWPRISENTQKSHHQTDSSPCFTPAVASWRLLFCQTVILTSFTSCQSGGRVPPLLLLQFLLIWEKSLRSEGFTCTDCNPFEVSL